MGSSAGPVILVAECGTGEKDRSSPYCTEKSPALPQQLEVGSLLAMELSPWHWWPL